MIRCKYQWVNVDRVVVKFIVLVGSYIVGRFQCIYSYSITERCADRRFLGSLFTAGWLTIFYAFLSQKVFCAFLSKKSNNSWYFTSYVRCIWKISVIAYFKLKGSGRGNLTLPPFLTFFLANNQNDKLHQVKAEEWTDRNVVLTTKPVSWSVHSLTFILFELYSQFKYWPWR